MKGVQVLQRQALHARAHRPPCGHAPRGRTCRSRLSSWCRRGMFSYSAALEMISMRPRTLVLAFRDMLKSSGRNTAS